MFKKTTGNNWLYMIVPKNLKTTQRITKLANYIKGD